MFRVLTYLTAVLALAAAFSHPVWAGSPEIGDSPQAIATFHLSVNPLTGEATQTASSPAVGVVLQKSLVQRQAGGHPKSAKVPLVGIKKVKLGAPEPVRAGISPNATVLAVPSLSNVLVRNMTNLVDKDGDGYYAFFNFDLGIAVRNPGASQQVMARILCNPTGQQWETDSWTVSGTQDTWVNIGFDRLDFQGVLTKNTDLYFIVELYDAPGDVKYDTKTTPQPFRADPIMYPCFFETPSITWQSNADEDKDGYSSHFSFGINAYMNEDRGFTYHVALLVVCETTGQAWQSQVIVVEGPDGFDGVMDFNEQDFLGRFSGNTRLDFSVKILEMVWDEIIEAWLNSGVVWDTERRVLGEPLLVDPIPLQIAEAGMDSVDRLRDEDGDGFYSQYDFNVGIRAETPTSYTVAARITCTTTGQIWDVPPWTIYPGHEFWQEVHFDEANFVGILNGNTQLYFRVDLYDAAWKTLLNSTSNIAGQPFPVDPVKAPDDAYALVRHFYNAVLGREPEPGAVDAWINGYFLYSLYSEIDVRFIGREMGRIFFFSQEYANRKRDNAGFIRDCYQAFLWRDPSQAEFSAWMAGIWDRTEALTIFSESEEFGDLMSVRWFPGYEGKPVRNFVTTMYVGFLDRLPDLGGLDYWSDAMERAADKRQASKDMALAMLHSAEYRAKKDSTRETVARLYRAIMGRFPADREVDYWALEITSGRRTMEQALETFCNTQEFTNHLHQYFG